MQPPSCLPGHLTARQGSPTLNCCEKRVTGGARVSQSCNGQDHQPSCATASAGKGTLLTAASTRRSHRDRHSSAGLRTGTCHLPCSEQRGRHQTTWRRTSPALPWGITRRLRPQEPAREILTASQRAECPQRRATPPEKGCTAGQQTPPPWFCLPPARSTKKVRDPYVGSSAGRGSAGAAAPGGSADTGLGAASWATADSCVPTAPLASSAGTCSAVVSTSTS